MIALIANTFRKMTNAQTLEFDKRQKANMKSGRTQRKTVSKREECEIRAAPKQFTHSLRSRQKSTHCPLAQKGPNPKKTKYIYIADIEEKQNRVKAMSCIFVIIISSLLFHHFIIMKTQEMLIRGP